MAQPPIKTGALDSTDLGGSPLSDRVVVTDDFGALPALDGSNLLNLPALADIVDDTSPQLGGGLDVNDNSIYGTAKPGTIGGTLSLQGGSGTSGGSVNIFGGVGTSSDGAIALHSAQIHLKPSTGVWSSLRAELFFFDSDASNHVRLKAPSVVTTNRAWELPQDDPTTVAGQFLTTNAGGALSFTPGPSVPTIYTSSTVAYGGAGTSSLFVHGLGTVPAFVEVYLVNVIAEGGFSPGEIISLSHTASESDSGGGPVYDGIGVEVTTTFVNVRVSSRGVPVIGVGYGGFNPTPANWNMYIKAMA